MEILHLRFSRWGAAVKLSGEVANPKELHTAVRNRTDISEAKGLLAQITSHFEDIARITTGRKVEDVVTRATDNEWMTCGTLVQRMRDLAHPRQCKTKTLRKVRRYLMLEKICSKSFRRQCKLSSGKASFIFCKEDKSKIAELTDVLAELMDDLEDYFSGNATVTRSCWDEEVSKILLEAPPGSLQLSLLKNTLLWRDFRLEEAIAQRQQGDIEGNPRVDENGFI